MTTPSYPSEVRAYPVNATVAARAAEALADCAPGWVLCAAVSGVAIAIDAVERAVFHRAWIESLVLAIVIGVAVRSLVPLTDRFHRGIAFCAKTVLEVAVLLLGASVSAGAVMSQGAGLLGAIVVVVALAIALGYRVGRLLGLHRELALLVACGNAICGNSAIAATAPVIGANGRDVAASIAFTAVLGVAVVLLLPVFGTLIDLTPRAYGIFAGLTVYAVPQVLAATAPVSALSVQVGTLVKLVRVLMLGPVLLTLSLWQSRTAGPVGNSVDAGATGPADIRPKTPWHHLFPWFVIGFLVLMGLRSAGAISPVLLAPAQSLSNLLTVVAMAALGLGVDIRDIGRAGGRVIAAALLSLLALAVLSLFALHFLGL
jgi:uncharacterized integral membrane protein (TIGR00698 family)